MLRFYQPMAWFWSKGSEFWLAGPNVPLVRCSAESWPRRQKVISFRSTVAVIHHRCRWLTAAYLPRIDWKTVLGGPKRRGQSMGVIPFSLNICFLICAADWPGSFWYRGLLFFLSLLCAMKRSGRRVMNTLVLAACCAFSSDVHGICARILLCPPSAAKNPQISLAGLIRICTLISGHIILSQRYGEH